MADLVSHEVRTICFLKSRKGIELIRKFAADRLTEKGRPDLAERIAPTGRATPRPSAAKSRRKLVSGELLGSPRPTRWSSASTSAASTPRSASPFPAPWPA